MVPGERKFNMCKLIWLCKRYLRIQAYCKCVQDEHAGEDTDEINTRNLKAFISKRKWQVSSLTEEMIPWDYSLLKDLTVFLSSISPALTDLHRVSSHSEAHSRAAGCSSQGNGCYRSPRASGTQQQLSE